MFFRAYLKLAFAHVNIGPNMCFSELPSWDQILLASLAEWKTISHQNQEKTNRERIWKFNLWFMIVKIVKCYVHTLQVKTFNLWLYHFTRIGPCERARTQLSEYVWHMGVRMIIGQVITAQSQEMAAKVSLSPKLWLFEGWKAVDLKIRRGAYQKYILYL